MEDTVTQDPEIARVSNEIARESPTRDADATRTRQPLDVLRVVTDGKYVRIWLDAPVDWRAQHRAPGQYITARFGESRHRFLVLANAPHESSDSGWELLVEPNADLAPVLDALGPGDTVLASGAEGVGFPVDFQGRQAVLIATGSGVAGLRPVLAAWSLRPEDRPERVVLYYEEEAGVPHAYASELRRWEHEAWLDVEFVTHEADRPFVAEQIDYGALDDSSVFLMCGAPAMIAAVSSRALSAGFDADDIHTNI
jgi:ferredoxin-NADP reductase